MEPRWVVVTEKPVRASHALTAFYARIRFEDGTEANGVYLFDTNTWMDADDMVDGTLAEQPKWWRQGN